MIIKRKFASVKKVAEENKVEEVQEPVVQEEQVVDVPVEQVVEEEVQEPVKDLNFSLQNVKFEQREERREGSRRRGYRRTQDRNIISRAQNEAKELKEAAKQEGYQAGIDKAVEDIAELKSKFSEVYAYKDELFNKVSECIMDISLEVAKKIIKKEIEVDKDATISIIKGALEEVNRTENKITLKVKPQEVALVKDKLPEIFADNSFEAKIMVVPDNNISDGGVIVETSNGLIDASIETQVAIIEKALGKQKEVN